MSTEKDRPIAPRVRGALSELQGMIAAKYPAATFEVSEGDDPEGVYLTPTVDVEDTDEVFDVVVDRLLRMQVDEHLPVYVFPVRPIARVLAELEAEAQARRPRLTRDLPRLIHRPPSGR